MESPSLNYRLITIIQHGAGTVVTISPLVSTYVSAKAILLFQLPSPMPCAALLYQELSSRPERNWQTSTHALSKLVAMSGVNVV
jgi:hypothetical protein